VADIYCADRDAHYRTHVVTNSADAITVDFAYRSSIIVSVRITNDVAHECSDHATHGATDFFSFEPTKYFTHPWMQRGTRLVGLCSCLFTRATASVLGSSE
jgi:hypothetical protein